MNAYETFHLTDPLTAEMALELVEVAFPRVHEWLPAEDRGEWILKHGLMHIIFKDDEYRGYFCIINMTGGAYLHFGTTGGVYAARDVAYGLEKAQGIAANVYGIPELFCEIDGGSIIGKLVSKLGFESVSGSTETFKIKYHGKVSEKAETSKSTDANRTSHSGG